MWKQCKSVCTVSSLLRYQLRNYVICKTVYRSVETSVCFVFVKNIHICIFSLSGGDLLSVKIHSKLLVFTKNCYKIELRLMFFSCQIFCKKIPLKIDGDAWFFYFKKCYQANEDVLTEIAVVLMKISSLKEASGFFKIRILLQRPVKTFGS